MELPLGPCAAGNTGLLGTISYENLNLHASCPGGQAFMLKF